MLIKEPCSVHLLPFCHKEVATLRSTPSGFTYIEDSGKESSVISGSFAASSSHPGKSYSRSNYFQDAEKRKEMNI